MLQLAAGGRRHSLSLLLCLAVAVVVAPRAADAWKNYTVGEDKGWYDGLTLPGVDYQEWADGKNFSLGDFLIFNTDKNHSVVQTRNNTLFKSCDYYDSGLDDTVEWSAAAPEFSKDAVTVAVPLLKEGRTYFFSGNYDGEQCENGQRFAIDVAHGQGLPPDLRPPAAPAPGPAAPDGVATFNFDHPKNGTTPNTADAAADDDGDDTTSGGRRASSGASRTLASSRIGTGLAVTTLLVAVVCRSQNRTNKGKYITIITSLLSSSSTAVVYDCAGALVSLSSAPTAVRAAATTYCQLLASQSDNNVKLIILDRLNELRATHREVMVGLVMDVLRALASPNIDVKRKVLDLVLDLLTPRNVEEVVLYLKKEVVKTQAGDLEKGGEYRQMLVRAIHACAVEYPEVAGSVVHLLMDFLGDTNVAAAVDVVLFVREIIETNPKLRVSMIQRLIDTFYQIRASRVCSCALWILGEYSLSLSEVESAIATIKQCLGDLPFYTVSEEGEATDSAKPAQPVVNSVTVSSRRPVVLADGTYATQSAATETISTPSVVPGSLASTLNLRSLILSGDFFLAAVVACTLTKLVLRLEEVQPSKVESNKASTGALLIMTSILQLGQSSYLPHPIDNDSYDRIVLCVRLLCNTGDEARKIWLQSCRESFAKMLAEKQFRETEEMKAKAQISHAQPDDLIDFYHLKSRRGMSQLELEDEVHDDLKAATGGFTKHADDANKLNRILQLTGFSDPVYAEAFVTVHHYDIVLDVTVINRTKETLQNLCLELATMGDLKLVDRPQNYTLAPESSKQIRANIKVSSTETGVIFGNIVYETSNVMERSVVVLNDIHIDIMDYISPATCADVTFRNMWAEFEWENKVAVNTVIQDEKEFLDHIIKSTNMKCLTPPSALDGECGFIAANLYAKSVFGEDALVNISIEKQHDGKLSGYIRIRSKTQGIALSLGDKITLKQKGGS
ncbi:hypothetical protein EJB05_32425 [Eragrostis curvula]|uniref:Phytocyanin domain-containing protein n=1 Tax=Eragrostis curvula TaxID=38414 RepID=A0A5J9UHQ2_9POAL|nr:hypothetical protein EJB05_32425 [Eragrostis curvula]